MISIVGRECDDISNGLHIFLEGRTTWIKPNSLQLHGFYFP